MYRRPEQPKEGAGPRWTIPGELPLPQEDERTGPGSLSDAALWEPAVKLCLRVLEKAVH